VNVPMTSPVAASSRGRVIEPEGFMSDVSQRVQFRLGLKMSRALFGAVAFAGAATLFVSSSPAAGSLTPAKTVCNNAIASHKTLNAKQIKACKVAKIKVPKKATAAAATRQALPDPCTLLTSSDVSGLGVSAGPTLGPKQTATDALPESSCTWGSAIDATGMVSVVVSTPLNGADAGDLLANGANGTSVSAGPDGKLLARAVIEGGGGVGKTIIFHKSGITVLVAKVGDNVDDGALTAAANSAAGRL
jgi:hypothetical protein